MMDDFLTFLTPEVLSEVIAEMSLPSSYTLEDDRPDGIEVRFPRCHLYVAEGFESNMSLRFLPESTGLDRSVSIADALAALRRDPAQLLPPRPPLIDFFSPEASLNKVKNELRDLFTLLLTYFRSSLDGDFAWVAVFRIYGQ